VFGGPRFKREDNIKIDFKEIVEEGAECVHVVRRWPSFGYMWKINELSFFTRRTVVIF